MTDFAWRDFAVPVTLLIVFMIIALATWLLHLLFPSPRVTPKTEKTIQVAPSHKTVRDQARGELSHDETMSHLPP